MLEHELEGYLDPRTGGSLQQILQSAIWYNSIASGGVTLDTPTALTMYWQGTDSEERYQYHMQHDHTRKRLEALNWIDAPIRYDLNSWGFRSHNSREFDTVTAPSLITLGCSFTYGTGLDHHSIWPQHLADAAGLELVNLGTPGHGLDMGVLWLLMQGDTIPNPHALVIYEPPPHRLSWLTRYPKPLSHRTVGICFLDELENLRKHTDAVTLLRLVSNMDINAAFAYYRNARIAEYWAAQKNIPCVYLSGRDADFSTDNRDLARDLAHNGRTWHCRFANMAHNKLKQLTGGAV